MRFISLLTVCLLIPTLAQAGERFHMRNYRYCEILLGKSLRQFDVYNTTGLNNCPENIWRQVTTAEVKKETHARFVHLNGPRYFIFDAMEDTTLINPSVKTFAGLPMRLAGILNLGIFDFFKGPYAKRQVERHTTWVYFAGKPVYELIDPQHNVFVMQSYSAQKQIQTESSLANLGKVLQLPQGWTFKTGILKSTQKVKAENNVAIVVQDNFENTYQQADHDLLAD